MRECVCVCVHVCDQYCMFAYMLKMSNSHWVYMYSTDNVVCLNPQTTKGSSWIPHQFWSQGHTTQCKDNLR